MSSTTRNSLLSQTRYISIIGFVSALRNAGIKHGGAPPHGQINTQSGDGHGVKIDAMLQLLRKTCAIMLPRVCNAFIVYILDCNHHSTISLYQFVTLK